jgi:hypothetical protein
MNARNLIIILLITALSLAVFVPQASAWRRPPHPRAVFRFIPPPPPIFIPSVTPWVHYDPAPEPEPGHWEYREVCENGDCWMEKIWVE